jgi:hypothetical protein
MFPNHAASGRTGKRKSGHMTNVVSTATKQQTGLKYMAHRGAEGGLEGRARCRGREVDVEQKATFGILDIEKST